MITYLNGFAFILLQKQFNFKNDMKMFLDNPLARNMLQQWVIKRL